MLDAIGPFSDFDSAARSILSYLHQQFGFQLWMVTRTQGEDWIMLQVEDQGYGVKEGDVFCWSDSFCSRMVKGEGPYIAPCITTVPAYREAPIGQQISIGSYIGMPIVLSDGSVFGTLCAIDPDPQSEWIQGESPTLELLAKLLSTILENELKYNQQARHLERVEAEAMNDVLTQVYNRRGWEKLLLAEEKRCQRYGHPAGVICIDLDDLKPINDSRGHAAGDQLIYQAAQTIDAAVREQDIIARVGGDEFAVLAIECNAVEIQALAERVQSSLAEADISASIGCAARHPSKGLAVAVEEADQKMYEHKRRQKSSSLSPELKCGW